VRVLAFSMCAAGLALGVAAPPVHAAPADLADGALDLSANRIRLHAYDHGLVVPLLGEGFRVYDQDAPSGWGPLRPATGPAGRTVRGLRADGATLTLPWSGGHAALLVRGAGFHRLTVTVDGKRRAAATQAMRDDAIGEVALDLRDLASGEHTLGLTVDRGGLTSVELALVELREDAWPAGCGVERDALTPALGGWPRLELLVEVPLDGALDLVAAGGGEAAVELVTEAGARTPLWRGAADGGHHLVSLAAWADQLVTIELLAPTCGVRWQGTRVGPTATAIAPPPPARPGPAKNLVLIVVDTLRADHLTVDGPTRTGAAP
jgi:hypothetical protein